MVPTVLLSAMRSFILAGYLYLQFLSMKTALWLALALLPFSSLAQQDNIGSGRAILFDGVDDYIDLGDIYDDVALPITISAWVYIEPDPVVKQYPIFDSQDNSLIYNGFTLVTSTIPHIGFTIGDGKGGNNPAYRRSRAGYFSTVGRWYYVTAVAKSGNDLQTYMNGHDVGAEYQGSSSYPMNSFSPTEVAKIGYFFGNGNEFWFKGVMDELRIWNRALSVEEIRESMCHRQNGDEPGLIGYWNFDETSGSDVIDLSPNGFDGVMKGNPTRVYSGAPVGNESVYLYTSNWAGKTLSKDGLTVSNISGNVYGAHVYTVNQAPSQTGGLTGPDVALPYYGVYLADDSETNTFDLDLAMTCSTYQRYDNSEPLWVQSLDFTGIKTRAEIIRGIEQAQFDVDLGDDVQLCDEDNYLLTPGGTATGKTFLWNTGATTQELSVTASGMYALSVSEGCQVDADTVMVSFGHRPPQFSLGDDEVLCSLEPRLLKPTLETGDYVFKWQDGSTNPTFEAATFGTYWLQIQNSCGLAADTITFTRKQFDNIQTYNFISPDNEDDFNQYFVIDDRLVGSKLFVFNRWGKQVFASMSYHNEWTGGELPSGVYFYTIENECTEAVKGTVTIMR